MLAPMIVPDPGGDWPDVPFSCTAVTGNSDEAHFENDDEKWISLLLCGSRGMSHEQVRHGDFTAISQRSTRYVDEAESPWVEHPLLTCWRAHVGDVPFRRSLSDVSQKAIEQARSVYDTQVTALQAWLEAEGVDKHTARKQARGAARGYLGNALYTEMIFSANVRQWLWMLNQRGSKFADAEIRVLYAQVLPQLQRSRYGDSFKHLRLEPSPDGIGEVVVG
jgi:thymidylate synthase ThyX